MVSDTVAHTTTVEPTRYKKARALLPRLPLCYYYYTAVELCWVSRTTTNRLLPATLLQAQKKWQGPGVRTGSASHSCGLFFVFNTRIYSTSLLLQLWSTPTTQQYEVVISVLCFASWCDYFQNRKHLVYRIILSQRQIDPDSMP